MNENRLPYLCEQGGKTQIAAEAFLKERSEVNESHWSFAEKYGAKSIYRGDRLLGVCIETMPDIQAWEPAPKAGPGVYRPRKKKSNPIYAEFSSIKPIPGLRDFARSSGISEFYDADAFYWPVPEIIGGKTVLQLHKDQEPPSDCSLMKMSEYYSLKEGI